jgi:hypothetical protein
MKIEVRSSGDKVCDQCGSSELLFSPNGSTREAVAVDIAAWLEQELIELEKGLMYLFEEREKAKMILLNEHEDRLAALLGDQAPFYKPLRRRFQRRLLEKVLEATDDLRDRTSRA